MDRLTRKYNRLKRLLRSYGSVLVAYSGGVDSTLLLKVAAETLGDRVLAVTADSPIRRRDEIAAARAMAASLGVRHLVVRSGELADERFRRNTPDRCYWCKRSLLDGLAKKARRLGFARVAVASQADDRADYRPGERAALEMGAVSPLRESGFTKREVRELSRRLGLPGWRREPEACFASRVPYGERIDESTLGRIARAEEVLRRLGFRLVRVRCRRAEVRIEVDARQVGRFFRRAVRDQGVRGLKGLGFLYGAADLEGYRAGSLNAVLPGRPRPRGAWGTARRKIR